MSLVDWINPFNKVADVVSEYVEDKDAKNRIMGELETLKQQVYMKELDTKTVPWVDAMHKMGRQILSVLSLIIPAVLIYLQPDIDSGAIAAMVAPGGVYNWAKGKGN